MTNTALLRQLIEKSGLKISHIAEKCGMSRQQFWRKVNNLSMFNQYEIDRVCSVLGVTSLKMKEAIFFHKK